MKPVHCPNCKRRLMDVTKNKKYEIKDLDSPKVAEPDSKWNSDLVEKCPQCRHLISIRYVITE